MFKRDRKMRLMSAMLFTAGAAFTFASAKSAPVNTVTSYVPAFYVAAQVGYANTHWDSLISNAPGQSIKDTGFAGRIAAGYDYNPIFGIELGWTHLPRSKFSNNNLTNTTTLEAYALDAMIRMTAPIASTGLGIYGKAGVGYLTTSLSQPITVGATTLDTSAHHVGPAFGAGISYNVTSNLIADASWLHYTGHSNHDSNFIPSPDATLIGIRYRIPTSVW